MDIKYLNLKNILVKGLAAFFLLSFMSSCFAPNRLSKSNKELENKIENNELFKEAFSAFVLFDPASNDFLFSKNGSKLFTPASNTKIVTLLASVELMGDSLPLLSYVDRNDTLFFSGTANPLNLNPYIFDNVQTIQWLKGQGDKELVYVPLVPSPIKYGPGWAWDDAMYYYQLENSAFPVYGNQIMVQVNGQGQFVQPDLFVNKLLFSGNEKLNVKQQQEDNVYLIQLPKGLEREFILPMQTSDLLLTELLSDTLDQKVSLDDSEAYSSFNWQQLSIPFPDSLYIQLMHESDNFIAEQLLLMASFQLNDTMDRAGAITHMTDVWEPFLQDTLRWVDGSGLSRYNLLTPRTNVQLLSRLMRLKSWEWIKKIFPSGGQSGTIQEWYFPYIYAKTGSLSNNHNLSGFIETKKGRVLIFSFMHNHFINSSSSYKKEMEEILKWVHENY